MQVYPSREQFAKDSGADSLLKTLDSKGLRELLGDGSLYKHFPIYRDDEGGLLASDTIFISPKFGVVAFSITIEKDDLSPSEFERCSEIVEQFPAYIYSRLIRNRALRRNSLQLKFEITPVVFAPLLGHQKAKYANKLPLVTSEHEMLTFFEKLSFRAPIDEDVYEELISTFEGSKGLIKPNKRDLEDDDSTSKKAIAAKVEAAISLFDHQQKRGMLGRITGPQRIRGLAGSGKTVVLAMKAALTLLENPNAKIAYTFYTKSLYQHVKRLITRFYRQFNDQDPDWDRSMYVIHGWGGSYNEGLYSIACRTHGASFIDFREASSKTGGDRFDYACKSLLGQVNIKPQFDYIFVDEGQDFPSSFMQLCHKLAHDGKFVVGYDDLQTIFQAKTPDSGQFFGKNDKGEPNAKFEEDVVLHKCYRNPREVLVAAHAVGFGIYGKKIVQMLESREHWQDVGYEVVEGDFVAGSRTKIERPAENSLTVMSENATFGELVKVSNFETMEVELATVVKSIVQDLTDGLKPEDVLVVCLDDRHAKSYLQGIERLLAEGNVSCNNLHSDSFGIRDFSKEGRVTLSTVHKAKGNEAFMVYAIGCDATMCYPNVRNRNMIFTAMTRAKGWLRMSGIGESMVDLTKEVNMVEADFPCLEFTYPDVAEIQLMKRDLADAADKKMRKNRLMDQLQSEYTDDEINEILMLSRKNPRRK